MVSPELIDYIRKTSEMGFPLDRIKQTVLDAGHAKNDVDEAIGIIFPAPVQNADRGSFSLALMIYLMVVLISGYLIFDFVRVDIYGKSSPIQNIVTGFVTRDSGATTITVNCANLKSSERDWCYYRLAKATDEYRYCTGILAYDIRSFCKDTVNGVADCTRIEDPVMRQECSQAA